MARARPSSLVVAVVTAALIAIGCTTISEVVTGRDLDCGTAPDDLCLRVVGVAETSIAGDLERTFPGERFTVEVRELPCEGDVAAAVAPARCWEVRFLTDDDDGIGTTVFELADGGVVGAGF